MSIRRWLAERLCPELAEDARFDRAEDPSAVWPQFWADTKRIPPDSVIWYGDAAGANEAVGNATPKVRIELTGPGRGEIWINGVKQERVVAFSLQSRAGGRNVLKVEYHDFDSEVVGDVDVEKPGAAPADRSVADCAMRFSYPGKFCGYQPLPKHEVGLAQPPGAE